MSNISLNTEAYASCFSKAFSMTTEKVKEIFNNSWFQRALGYVIGLELHRIITPLTLKVLTILGTEYANPLASMGVYPLLLAAPFICVIIPIIEEKDYRLGLQDQLKEMFKWLFSTLKMNETQSKLLASISSIFFSSIIFGLIHFSNAIIFWCNPMLFLPQVIGAVFLGMIFGIAKELTGRLDVPIGMHIGNNVAGWASYLQNVG